MRKRLTFGWVEDISDTATEPLIVSLPEIEPPKQDDEKAMERFAEPQQRFEPQQEVVEGDNFPEPSLVRLCPRCESNYIYGTDVMEMLGEICDSCKEAEGELDLLPPEEKEEDEYTAIAEVMAPGETETEIF